MIFGGHWLISKLSCFSLLKSDVNVNGFSSPSPSQSFSQETRGGESTTTPAQQQQGTNEGTPPG